MSPTVADTLGSHRLVPVIVLDDVAAAAPLGEALASGGLPVAEITLRTPSALESIARMAEQRALTVGAGTVLTPRQVEEAAHAGASFIVSPGFDIEVAEKAAELDLLHIPGVATATEVLAALRSGATLLKFFPAGHLGGPRALQALGAPFPDVRFLPTGGIAVDDLDDYLSLRSVAAVGGSFMVPAEALARGDFELIARRVGEAVARVRALPRTADST